MRNELVFDFSSLSSEVVGNGRKCQRSL
jgi:hypothetical protein